MNPFSAAGGQIQGRRKRQEDAFAMESFAGKGLLAGVADGLGGHPGGDVASREGLREFSREFLYQRKRAQKTPRHWLDQSLHAAQRHLLKRARDDDALLGMATTLVALYAEGQSLWSASVGDSYLLRFRQGKLLRLNQLHGGNGGVTSAIGFNLAQLDLAVHPLEAGDRYLLASDGIVALNDDELSRVLAQAADPETAVRTSLAAVEAQAHLYQDNVTLVAVFV